MLRFLPLLSLAAVSALAAERGHEGFEQKIRPLLEQYCYDCHADGVDKGNFTFDKHSDYASLRRDMKFWDHVRQQLVTHVMPPEKKPAPSLQERDAMVAWIDDAIFWFDPAKPDPGHVTWRRLNRTEYNNTVRDLLYVDSRPAREFPPDDTGYGYDNIGDVLSLSPMLMEKYLRASRKIAADALNTDTASHADLEFSGRRFYRSKGETREEGNLRWFNTNAETAIQVKAPAEGEYTLLLQVAATEAGNEPAKIALRIAGKEVSTYDVTTRWKAAEGPWQVIRQTVHLKAGDNKVAVAFLNDHSDPQHADPAKRDRNVVLAGLSVKGPHHLLPPSGTRFVRWLLDNKPAGLPFLQLTGEDLDRGEGASRRDTGGILLASRGYVKHPLNLTEAGKYRLSVKAGAQQAGDEPAKFEVRLAGRTIGAFAVTAKNQAPQFFNFDADLPAGAHELQIWFLNDFYNADTKEDRNLWVHQFRIEGPLGLEAGIAAAEVPGLVEKMGTRLFRRPMRAEESKKWRDFAALALKEGEKPMGALRFTLEGLLASPAFLFRASPEPAGSAQHGAALIDEYSLASRLAYFLWSAPPDDTLLQLAAKNELRANLDAQVKRMLDDWRAAALTENFAGQWLQLRDMDIISPDTRAFPDWRGDIAASMKRESQIFFEHILKENRSVLEFLDADYTFLNAKLSKWYGIGDVKGDKFEKVSLAGTPRGGILTHGSVLTLTSGQTRTSPIKRGKYLLENILGMPPPPAPGGVPPLDEGKVRRSNQTLREQFAKHREHISCAGCHAFLDPMGFAFEHYDAVGRWRDMDKKSPVDASGRLVRGQAFKDLAELRSILARDMTAEFTRNLTENLLTYALGRGLSYSDKPAVQEIVRRTQAADHRFQAMILAVCESVPFQKMRVGDWPTE